MTSVTRATLYTYFETGDTPTQAQFANLIDSNLNLATTSGQSITSDVSALGSLDVSGILTIKSSSQSNLTGNTVIGGTLSVSAATSLSGSLNVTGASVLGTTTLGATSMGAATATTPSTGNSSTSVATTAFVLADIPIFAAGFVNKFRNVSMDIAQRGAGAQTVSTSGAYVLDGWIVLPSGASCTSQQTATNARTGARVLSSMLVTGAASVTDIIVKQRIESYVCGPLNGQTVTVQAQVYNNTGGSITPTLTVKHANAQDNWGASTTDVSAVSLQACANGAWTQVAYTFTASSSSNNGLEVAFDFGNNFTTSGKSIQISELDIRATPGITTGTNSNPPVPEFRSIAIEYPISLRYARRLTDQMNSGGNTATTSIANGRFAFPVPLRTAPTSSIITAGSWVVGNDFNAEYTASTVTISSTNLTADGGRIGLGGFAGTLPTAGTWVACTGTAGTAVLLLSAEL